MKVVDLFCGCGGLSLGFQKAGMDVVAAFDNWPDALAVYRNNFSHPAIHADLMNVERILKTQKLQDALKNLQDGRLWPHIHRA